MHDYMVPGLLSTHQTNQKRWEKKETIAYILVITLQEAFLTKFALHLIYIAQMEQTDDNKRQSHKELLTSMLKK